jgi:hypothetical protein
MGVLPLNFVDGDILTAANVNQMNSARDGFVHPIDPATRDEDDNVQDLGSASNRWKRLHANEATFGSTDDVTIGAKTLTQILEDNQIDAYGTEELFNNSQSGILLLSNSFIKASGDKIVRVMVTAIPLVNFVGSITIAFTNGKTESRGYSAVTAEGANRGGSISYFTDIFDISSVSDGATIQIDVTAGVAVTSSTFVFKNAF